MSMHLGTHVNAQANAYANFVYQYVRHVSTLVNVCTSHQDRAMFRPAGTVPLAASDLLQVIETNSVGSVLPQLQVIA